MQVGLLGAALYWSVLVVYVVYPERGLQAIRAKNSVGVVTVRLTLH